MGCRVLEEEPTMKLTSVRLLVSDFPASFSFWRDVMQFPVIFGPDTPGAPNGYAYLVSGEVGVDAGVELIHRDGFAEAIGVAPTPAPSNSQTCLDFKVDDVDATYAELVARGAPSVAAPTDHLDWGARTAHISDPDGNIIELYTSLGGNA
jgi:lactoylglutathione lyase